MPAGSRRYKRSEAFDGEIGQQVEIDRRGESEAVQTVEHAAVAGNETRSVLDAEVALDGAHRDVAEEAGEGHDCSHDRRVRRRQRREIGGEKIEGESSREPAADRTF